MNKCIMVNEYFLRESFSWNASYIRNQKAYAKENENYTLSENSTFDEEDSDYIFDRLGVRIPFIVVYSVVFCCCVFGNLMVILLVVFSRRLKSTTNFFLANLAFADLCVGVFCVFQNLAFYLITTWVFGDFLCKMNQFIHGLSCTASIFILVVICVERYLAIIHPIRCKQILTRNRLKIIISLVWIISTAYSMPRYLISHTISNPLSGSSEIICIMSRIRYNSKLFDIINFILLYLIPLGIMTALYSLIGLRLGNSNLNYPSLQQTRGNHNACIEQEELQNSKSFCDEKINLSSVDRRRSYYDHRSQRVQANHYSARRRSFNSESSYRSGKNILRARRRVIRMLTIIVLAFAVCNLPFHARKMWQYWSKSYNGASTFSSLFTPITFLCTYCNSAINPILYALLSKNFQKSMKELFTCSWRKSNKCLSLPRHKSLRRSLNRAYSISNNR